MSTHVTHPPHAGPFLLDGALDAYGHRGEPRRVEVYEEDVETCDECGGREGGPNEPRCSACGGSGGYAYLWWIDPWTGTTHGTGPRMAGLAGRTWTALDDEPPHDPAVCERCGSMSCEHGDGDTP